jgi:signal peptidase I
MAVDSVNAANLRSSAERSALLAEVLRQSDGLPRSVRLQVYGESMMPALWPGDVVEIASCSLKDVLSGEIVLALREGRLFLHRLVAARDNSFQLCGDSMPHSDPEFSADALLGKLVCSPASRLRVKCSRAVGLLLCHCAMLRRLALRLHSRRQRASLNGFPALERF